jgi:hypothetical protein
MCTTRSVHLLAIAGLALAVMIWGPIADSAAAVAFAPAASIATSSNGNADVAAGDLDQDGAIDLVVASCGADCGGNGSGGIDVLTNDGTGSFTGAAPLADGIHPRHVVLADLNNDGDPDLIVGHQDGFDVRLGADGTTFGTSSAGPTPTFFNYGIGPGTFPSIAVGDVNKDGKLDVVNANRSGPNNVQVRLGDGTGALGAPTNYTSGAAAGPAPYDVLLLDLNFDDSLDIVVANSAEGTLTYRKQSGGTFNSAQTIGTEGQPVSLAVGKIVLDPTDLVVADRTSSLGLLLTSPSTSNPTPYQPIRTYPTGSPSLAVAVASLQGFFGLSDVVSRQEDGTYKVFLNSSSFLNPLSDPITLTGLAQPADADSSVLAVDVNGDGALDVIGTNYGVAGVTLFRQLPVVSASAIDFDDQAVGGRSVPRSITVSNSSMAPLKIASDSLTGADAADFVVITDGCVGATLVQGQSCAVAFRFKPSALGARTASLTFTDNGNNGGRTVGLSGVGVAPASSVTGPAGPTGANGANGANGGNGANGASGQAGAAGAAGPQGDQGPQGAAGGQGVAGAQGPKGDTGARGPAGRDATVTCKPGKQKKGRVRVTCTVRFAASGKARARLSRRGVVYAHGSGRVARHAAALDLHTVRRMPPGEYTMRVRFGGGRLVSEVVRIR